MHIGFYGPLVLALLLFKGIAASVYLALKGWKYREVTARDVSILKVAAVVPMYNEDPDTFEKTLKSLLYQTRLPAVVTVVDDGSKFSNLLDLANSYRTKFEELGIVYNVLALPENQGKRHALAAGFNAAPDADVYLCVDSDTVLMKHAVKMAVDAFHDPRVTAVTGLVLAYNSRKNLLTRLQHLRYANAFLFERGAYSLFGSVLCACGSLALYDANVVRANLEDFLNQQFLGQTATFGDDRRLTNYALRSGRVVMTPKAVAYTVVPQKVSHYLRQQVRWAKSFVRETLWVLRNRQPSTAAFRLSALEAVVFVVFPAALVTSVVLSITTLSLSSIGWYAVAISGVSYLRSVLFLSNRVPEDLLSRLGIFALAPLYGLANLLVLMWVRLYALLTLKQTHWGTREAVEVEISPDEELTVA